MIAVLSPAKTMDFSGAMLPPTYTSPERLDWAEPIMARLKKLSQKKLADLQNISADLAKLNAQRNQSWTNTIDPAADRPSIQAFKGDVYRGLDIAQFGPDDFAYAQDHLRILSGLYGLLRPLDLIKPYRLEMGTTMPIKRKKNLYAYWDNLITKDLNNVLSQHETPLLVNLASKEYFKAINPKNLDYPIITCTFKDMTKGGYKIVMTYAKLARGAMAAHMVHTRAKDVDALKTFTWEGYGFQSAESTDQELIFTRG